MKLSHRFWIANGCALLYAGICLGLAQWWLHHLTALLGSHFLSLLVILFIAIIPGYLNILLLATLYVYRYPPLHIRDKELPPISLLIAAYNEEDVLRETFRGIRQQEYPQPIEIIVVDDGSTDQTVAELKKLNLHSLKIIQAPHGGKANALNRGLGASSHDILVTIDADTFLYQGALKRIVARLTSDPSYAAVAGHVLVKNERMSRLARMQAWDYMLGISAVKRQQGLFQGTLVAQGAFSAFRKKPLEALQGWRDRIGEDIVLTWSLLRKGHRIGYEPTAFAFTNAPLDYRRFSRQRQRWARGMIEGFKDHLNLIWRGKHFSSFFVALDLLFPLIDFFFTFVFIPGVILVFWGYYHIAGLYTLLVIPINLCIILAMLRSQKRFMRFAGLRIRQNPVGLVCYVLLYQFLMSPICVLGYAKEMLRLRRRW